jgi:hypothetical protein
VAVVKTDVSEERITSIVRVTRISETVTSSLILTPMTVTIRSSLPHGVTFQKTAFFKYIIKATYYSDETSRRRVYQR